MHKLVSGACTPGRNFDMSQSRRSLDSTDSHPGLEKLFSLETLNLERNKIQRHGLGFSPTGWFGATKKIAPKNLTDLDGTEVWKNGFKKRVRFGHFGDFPNKEIHHFWRSTVDVSEIPRPTTWNVSNLINNAMLYIYQLVRRISEPSTVCCFFLDEVFPMCDMDGNEVPESGVLTIWLTYGWFGDFLSIQDVEKDFRCTYWISIHIDNCKNRQE